MRFGRCCRRNSVASLSSISLKLGVNVASVSATFLMGRKGWAVASPADDDEACKRIIDATVSDSADVLGVTRRTVYCYFATTKELFSAVADLALRGFVARLQAITANMGVTEELIDVVAHIIERLPDPPRTSAQLRAYLRRWIGPALSSP